MGRPEEATVLQEIIGQPRVVTPTERFLTTYSCYRQKQAWLLLLRQTTEPDLEPRGCALFT